MTSPSPVGKTFRTGQVVLSTSVTAGMISQGIAGIVEAQGLPDFARIQLLKYSIQLLIMSVIQLLFSFTVLYENYKRNDYQQVNSSDICYQSEDEDYTETHREDTYNNDNDKKSDDSFCSCKETLN